MLNCDVIIPYLGEITKFNRKMQDFKRGLELN